MYYKHCCYCIWQVLIRILSSCCFQTEKNSFTCNWNESFEEHRASPLSFAFRFKAAEYLWHNPVGATHSQNLMPLTLSCHYLALLRHQQQSCVSPDFTLSTSCVSLPLIIMPSLKFPVSNHEKNKCKHPVLESNQVNLASSTVWKIQFGNTCTLVFPFHAALLQWFQICCFFSEEESTIR